jgi:hypothetical protein
MIEERNAPSSVVIAGLDPVIHSVALAMIFGVTEWMPWTSHGMTISGVGRMDYRETKGLPELTRRLQLIQLPPSTLNVCATT